MVDARTPTWSCCPRHIGYRSVWRRVVGDELNAERDLDDIECDALAIADANAYTIAIAITSS